MVTLKLMVEFPLVTKPVASSRLDGLVSDIDGKDVNCQGTMKIDPRTPNRSLLHPLQTHLLGTEKFKSQEKKEKGGKQE